MDVVQRTSMVLLAGVAESRLGSVISSTPVLVVLLGIDPCARGGGRRLEEAVEQAIEIGQPVAVASGNWNQVHVHVWMVLVGDLSIAGGVP